MFLHLHQHNYISNYKNATLDLCLSKAFNVGVNLSNTSLVTLNVYHPSFEVPLSVSHVLKRVRAGETNKLLTLHWWNIRACTTTFPTSTGP